MLGDVYNLNLSYTGVSDVSALGRVHTLDLEDTNVTEVIMLVNVKKLNLRESKTDVSTLGRLHFRSDT